MHPLAIVGALEAGGYMTRAHRRLAYWTAARDRARASGRAFIVVGAPGGGMTGGYGCGDRCVDLRGCERCGSPPADVTQPGSIPVRNDSAVIFTCCVLELVTDPYVAWREHLRAAGRLENIYLVRIQPWTMTKLLYPDVRWQIDAAPPEEGYFRASSIYVPRPLLDCR